jgi:hypothetical protein
MERFRAWYTIIVTCVLFFGEAAAIVGLAEDVPLKFHIGYAGWFILGALIVGGFGVVAPILITQLHILLPGKGIPPLPRTVLLLAIAAFIIWLLASLTWALVH